MTRCMVEGPFMQSDAGVLAVAKDGCAVTRLPAEADERKSIRGL
ncbi:hypothetical protein AG1IA_10426 [Rhizoctonia solani AG-1 IA]|uniref:Uncharacterized protein n=1 Tax=Thanatephorus cucumeris (strain AG1-IA) TaxID=983506 RepID=L8WC54_THACA|nr:hypothetical protein AG1IA_10426 [Rhizoctonia solani AG-1 IA]